MKKRRRVRRKYCDGEDTGRLLGQRIWSLGWSPLVPALSKRTGAHDGDRAKTPYCSCATVFVRIEEEKWDGCLSISHIILPSPNMPIHSD